MRAASYPAELRSLEVEFSAIRLIEQIPPSLGYEYVSVGQMIRDEINKKTNYSKIIL
jgi:hypothetical protein